MIKISCLREKKTVTEKPWQNIHKFTEVEVFFKKSVLRNLAKFTGKPLCQSLFFNKVAGGA